MNPAPAHMSRSPSAAFVAVVAISTLPFLLNLLGVDFSSRAAEFGNHSLDPVTDATRADMLRAALVGSITHSILEWSALCVAAITVILALIYYMIRKDNITAPIIGVALFCAACIDAFHISAANQIIGTATDTSNAGPFTWALGRSFNALIMIAGALFVLCRPRKGTRVSLAFVCATGLALGAIAYETIQFCNTRESLSVTTLPGAFISRPYDLAPLVLFLVAGWFVYPLLRRRHPSFLTQALCLSAIPNVAVQLHMAIGSSQTFDNDFNIAHFLKVVAYAAPLAGLCVDFYVRHCDATANRERLRAIVSTAADGIITIDQKGLIESFNRTATQLFGYTEDEAVGMEFTNLMPFPYREQHRDFIESYMRAGAAETAGTGREVEGLRRDGSTFLMHLNVSTFEIGGRTLVTGLVRDVTRRRKTEGDLRTMSVVVEQSPAAVMITDKDGTIEYVNPRFTEVTGYLKEDVIGQNPRILKSGKWPKKAYTNLWKTILAGKIWRGEFHNRKKSGEMFWEWASISPMRNEQGEITHFISIKEDITHRKQTEELLHQQNIALTAKNRDLDEFTHVASHDLQEPLRKLIAFSALLKTDLGGDLPEKAAQDIHFITDAATRMENLVYDLLLLARCGRDALTREETSLDECVDRAMHALQDAIEESGVRFERDPLPDVVADHASMTQLYQNLIENALKYRMPDRAPVVRITAENTNDGAVFGVSDNGIGMDPQYLEQIFAPFRKLHGRGEYEGSGIGLAICRKVVEQHGGQIWAESALGEGAHFKFTVNRGKGYPLGTNELVVETLSC